MNDLALLSLCDGYGGTELALKSQRFERAVGRVSTVCRVERDAYAAAVLVARMEEARLDKAPIWDQLETFDGAAWRGRVDIVAAGFPCQPFSAAGQRRGVDDDRWLWPQIARIIREVGPRYVLLENVPQLVRHGLPYVLDDLAQGGFDAEWGLYPAFAVGAPHKRERLWLVGYPAQREPAAVFHTRRSGTDINGTSRRPRAEETPNVADAASARRKRSAEQRPIQPVQPRSHRYPPSPDDREGWERWLSTGGPEPAVCRDANGPPRGLADALHLGGNGLVPQCAAEAWAQLFERSGCVW